MGMFDKLQSMFRSDRVDIGKRFELLREDMSGTMSTFYMARDHESGKTVGLKIGDREKVAAFESRFKGLKKPSEGEIGLQMKHPLIVETYEHGRTTDGLTYIVMEYVKGPGLHMMLYNRAPELEGNRCRVIRQMAEAVEHVHVKKFIHRDVCPRNFIYEPTTENVRLIDFGLTLPARREFMQPGNRTGNPLYMAPEVIRRRWTDQRLDIFALGVSAYQICTCELPWPVTEMTGQAAMAHDTYEPRDILAYRPTLDPTLGKAIMKCIQPDPKNRPQSVDQFLKLIKEVASDDRA